ncbi:MAG: hypothetical protein JRJ86_14840 [Deltaproteobacteria bacterium]|nr:hypothetical protein [Deltaproteobacteria bacterium]MBW2119080.1 hypothetical protein [Deltaproteobacteria bacterium]
MNEKDILNSPVPVAVVFPARQTNSLGVIRSLGKRGIPVIGLDNQPMSVGFYSRFCKGMLCPGPAQDAVHFIQYLVNLGKRLKTKGVLYLMDDYYVFLATKYREMLEKYFLFSFLDFEAIHNCMDKSRMYMAAKELGIPVPKTYLPDNSEDISEIAREISYPCLIKPVGKFEITGNSAEKVYGFFRKYGKALRAPDEKSLFRLLEEVTRHGFRVVVQEEISGGPDQLYSLGVYCNKDSEILMTFTGRKLRQIPPDFGTCTLAEAVNEPLLIDYGKRFLKEIKFWGIAELEFKKDRNDGEYKFLEINPRAWTWISLATACGVDLAHTAYLDLTGQQVIASSQDFSKVKWIDLAKDIICFLKYRTGDRYIAGMTFKQWLLSLRGPKTFIYFNETDPLPGILIPLQLLRSRLGREVTSF